MKSMENSTPGTINPNEARLVTVLSLTILLLIIYGFPQPIFRFTAIVAAAVAVSCPRLILSSLFWLPISSIGTLSIYIDWYTLDNHKFLLCYWSWAVTIALTRSGVDEKMGELALSARIILALLMLSALVQKCISTDYFNGSFFTYVLLTDPRFEEASAITGMSAVAQQDLNLRISALHSSFVSMRGDEFHVYIPPALAAAALAITWINFGLQLMIEMTNLICSDASTRVLHKLLLFFIISIYAFAPVIGFGWLLALLGMAISATRDSVVFRLYVLCFPLLSFYELVWS